MFGRSIGSFVAPQGALDRASLRRGRIVRAVPALCDATRVRAAEAFVKPHAAKLEGVEKDLRQSVEEGMRCAALADAHRDEASRWLRARH